MRRFAALAIVLAPTLLGAQGLRISGVTVVQLVDIRPLVIDSLPANSVPGTGEWRSTSSGVPAICPETSAFCQFEASTARATATPLLQDLTIAGWGWVEGLSFQADVRARTQLSGTSTFVYPRTDDHFDVLDAFAQLARASWQARLGRQWARSGLGAYDFDGGDLLVHRDQLSIEGWAGRALVEGLNDPYTSAQLAAVDNLPPQQQGYLFGARARYRSDALTAASLTYQRILIADRSGLYSERAAFDASTKRLGAALDLDLTYDFATADWNEARLRVASSSTGILGWSAELRHSRPYFELWTIWGAFSPVGFDEGRATIDWRPHAVPLAFAVRGAYRQYADANTSDLALRTNGWRAGADVIWRGESTISASGSYDVDIGSGAANTDVRADLRWIPSPVFTLGGEAMIAQNIYEFRVGTGRIYGLSLDGSRFITADVQLELSAGIYRHTLTNGAPGPDWSQRRGVLRLEWMLGRDPGLGAVPR